MATLLLSLLAIAPLLAGAAITPTWPGGKGLVFRAGDTCSFRYNVDPTGTWKSMALDLMSGSNYEMVEVTRIASNLDGTVGGAINFTCPEVDPPAPIYFLEATQDGKDPVWTNRFALAAPNGSVVPAPHNQQPDDESIPWGVGVLVNGTNSTSPSSTESLLINPLQTATAGGNSLNPFAQDASSKPFDQPLMPTTTTAAAVWGGQPAATSVPGISGFQRMQKCDKSTLCPDSAPCCSEEGFCGAGRNCLAGCNPLASFQPEVCAPVPACVGGEYQLNTWNANRILTNSSTWTGDAMTYDWLVDKIGKPELGAMTASSETGVPSLTLSLTELGKGTVLTSTRSVLYGNVTARIKSVAGAGILTSFALLSGTEDEITVEFTTNATDVAHTAYFHEGDVDNYSSGLTLNITDRSADFHNYTISWTPDAITWLVDGVALRNVSKNSTADPLVPGSFRYPQTPSRIQLSIWAAGREGQPDGLVDFAGGAADWTAGAYMQKGYYASYISAIDVQCYDPAMLRQLSLDTNSPGSYNSSAGLNISASGSPESAASATSAPTTTLWWTPPVADTPAASTSSTDAHVWTPPVKARSRRQVSLEKVKRDATTIGSYIYALGQDGLLAVSGGNAPTVIANDAATGLDMEGSRASIAQNVASVATIAPMTASTAATPTSTSESTTANAKHPDSTQSASPSSAAKTIREKWDALGTAAHIGIYIGAAVVALFVLVLIGWLWRKAASARSNSRGKPPPDAGGSYFPINDRGEMLPAGQIYSGTGEIQPGQDLYSGGQAPAAAGAAAAPLRRSSTKSSSASRSSKYAAGAQAQGYVPSSQLKERYDVGYQPQAMRQV